MIRIIAGEWKGRKLKTPPGRFVRPTSDRVREALFNILGDVTGFKVLDLFAGTGALGIEALSRGADSAVFADRDSLACRIVSGNLEIVGGGSRAAIWRLSAAATVEKASKEGMRFDLIFVDPPYDSEWTDEIRKNPHFQNILAADGLAVFEFDVKNPPTADPNWRLVDERHYGGTGLTFQRPQGL